jgi:hypothetical protein
MAKYMEDGPPGRLTIIVVSIEGVAVLEPFSEVRPPLTTA